MSATLKHFKIVVLSMVHGLDVFDVTSGRISIIPSIKKRFQARVARFFFVQHTKTGENIPNDLISTTYTK
jgi:hypothetical protein